MLRWNKGALQALHKPIERILTSKTDETQRASQRRAITLEWFDGPRYFTRSRGYPD